MPRLIDYTTDLKHLTALAGQPDRVDDVLARALESLASLVPHDLAAVLHLDGNRLDVRAARGPLASDRVRNHSIDLAAFPSIRRALETRRAVVLEDHDHDHDTGEGDPYDGVIDLPHGHSCMVVPLHAADRDLGVVTFDRTVCQIYDPETVTLAETYAQIMALAILYADQTRVLNHYRETLEEQRHLDRDSAGHDPAGAWLSQARASSMQNLVRQAQMVAQTPSVVLIQGETGTGKEVLARSIHDWSGRREQPFVTLNCAALPEELIESELFGHVRGAFTGAARDRRGRFVTANGGTLLLDEIGDMPPNAQAKLLRVLQEGTFQPVGSDDTIKVDVRVMAASHVDLQRAVAEHRFREDLYYRLAIFPLHIPPLRQRVEDIVPMAEHLLQRVARRTGRGPWTLSQNARQELQRRPWPGNVRELANALERAAILKSHGELHLPHVAEPGRAPAPAPEADHDNAATILPLREMERRHLQQILDHTDGKIYGDDGAAVLAGLKPTTLISRLKKLGLR